MSDQFELADAVAPISEVFSHLLADEFVMVVLFLWPFCLGVIASLRAMTGVDTKADEDDDEGSTGGPGNGAVAASIHADVEKSTETMTSSVQKVEKHLDDLQRSHDTRFADLHKDLAGIVWEVRRIHIHMLAPPPKHVHRASQRARLVRVLCAAPPSLTRVAAVACVSSCRSCAQTWRGGRRSLSSGNGAAPACCQRLAPKTRRAPSSPRPEQAPHP